MVFSFCSLFESWSHTSEGVSPWNVVFLLLYGSRSSGPAFPILVYSWFLDEIPWWCTIRSSMEFIMAPKNTIQRRVRENRLFRTTTHCWSSISGIPDLSQFKRVLSSVRSFNTYSSSINWYLPYCQVSRKNIPCIILINASASWAPVWTHRNRMPSDKMSSSSD